MRRETSRVSFLMCPFCVRALVSSTTTVLTWKLRAREENGSDSRRPKHNASARQRCRNSRVKRRPLCALKGSLDRVLPAMPVVDERHAEQRIADAEQLIRPRSAARELRYEFAGGKADRECRQTTPPPREVCALGREPCATCGVFNLHASIKPRLGTHISIRGRCGRVRRAPTTSGRRLAR